MLVVACADGSHVAFGDYEGGAFQQPPLTGLRTLLRVGGVPEIPVDTEVQQQCTADTPHLNDDFWVAFCKGLFALKVFRGDRLWTKMCPLPVQVELCDGEVAIWISSLREKKKKRQ